jgi:hypothetical protein
MRRNFTSALGRDRPRKRRAPTPSAPLTLPTPHFRPCRRHWPSAATRRSAYSGRGPHAGRASQSSEPVRMVMLSGLSSSFDTGEFPTILDSCRALEAVAKATFIGEM